MITTPRLVDVPSAPAALIHITVPRAEIQQVMGPAFGELAAALAAQGITPAGPFFSHHLRMEADTFDFDLGVPVASPVAPVGRVQPGEQPGGRVAQTVYQGGYEGLSGGWSALMAWLEAEGQPHAPNLWERYLTGPADSPDPADWRTELNRPVG